MTNGGARMVETEAVIFQMESNQETDSIEKEIVEQTVEEKIITAEFKERFARLKKSLRKKSVNIL